MKILKDRSMAQENHLRKTLHDQETKFNLHIEQVSESDKNKNDDKIGRCSTVNQTLLLCCL